MKLADIDRVNHLVSQLTEMRALIHVAEQAEPASYQLFIESGGDSSLRMSSEGTSTSHAGGVAVGSTFLNKMKELAVDELRSKRDAILMELTALGVDVADS
jgi:hypothetical protein